jgi:hypothetical protein
VQVTGFGCRGREHGSEQRCRCNELLNHARRCVRVVDVEVGVDTLAGLLA